MSEKKDIVDAAKTTAEVVSAIVKAAGDDPKAKEAAHNIGESAVVITRLINNALMPLAAVNFAFQKAREYFSRKFQADLAEKTAKIPLDKVVEPKASIAGPALQGLAFTHEEADLREMYLSLLATAMDGRTSSEAHPAFVEIIKQLTAEEALLLKTILCFPSPEPIVELRARTDNSGGWTVVARHILNYTAQPSGVPLENPRLAAMVDNWIRLGLVEVSYSSHLIGEDKYRWAEDRPELVRAREGRADPAKVYCHQGIISKTALGAQFARSVGLYDLKSGAEHSG
jgi:hypothetical protein